MAQDSGQAGAPSSDDIDWPEVPLPPVDWSVVATPEERGERVGYILDHITQLVEHWNYRSSFKRVPVGKL